MFDRFHVMKLFNDKLSELAPRACIARRPTRLAQGSSQRHSLAAAEAAGKPGRLRATSRSGWQEALRLNEPLATAYYLKEELAEVWEQEDQEEPRRSCWTGSLRPNPAASACCMQFARTLRIPCPGNPGLLRLPHLHRSPGRHQQQDQNHETTSLRLPRPRIPQTQNLRASTKPSTL